MIIRASDPNAPDNIQDYNFAEQVFKPRPTDPKTQVVVHFERAYRFARHPVRALQYMYHRRCQCTIPPFL